MHGPSQDEEDRRWMRAALSLAGRGLGNVAPNPAVGCVLVRDGAPVGRGWTQPGGRPHAETEALRRAGEAARGATAYVTLEPCSHGRNRPLRRRPDRRRDRALRRRHGRPGRPRFRARARADARGGDHGRNRRRGSRRPRLEPWVRAPPDRRPPARHPQNRDEPGRPHRDGLRGEQVDHRPGGPRRRSPPPHDPRRGPGRHRHGPGGRSVAHLSLAGDRRGSLFGWFWTGRGAYRRTRPFATARRRCSGSSGRDATSDRPAEPPFWKSRATKWGHSMPARFCPRSPIRGSRG
jgi:hypothetical protein